MGWFFDRKDPKNELEGLERAQKLLDDRYEKRLIPEEVYRKQCIDFAEKREKYRKKLVKDKYDI